MNLSESAKTLDHSFDTKSAWHLFLLAHGAKQRVKGLALDLAVSDLVPGTFFSEFDVRFGT